MFNLLVPLIILLPLLGVVVNGLLGYRIGRRGVAVIGWGVVGLSFLLSIVAAVQLNALHPEERHVVVSLWQWVNAGSFQVPVEFYLDPLSALMILIVTGIGFLIHVYSAGYMADDRGYARYFAYLNLFVFSMLMLVLGGNFLLLFMGWELVGACSYLLIGFWFSQTANASAGRKAFVVNRIGDFGFALGIMLIFAVFGSLGYVDVFARAPSLLAEGGMVVTVLTLLLFIGAVGKSAQIPLYVWLPDAMAGPTPVSALIHAATMVTAGVYMIARSNVLYDLAPTTQLIVATIGALTAIMAAFIALTQVDIKRVLAYSTVSQLGFMVLAVGAGAYTAGVFHLFTHAFFKALLFLGAGSVMHAIGNEQDMRKMGGLYKYIRVTAITFIIGAAALAGIFPLSGFWSKDEILAGTFYRGGWYVVLYFIGLVTAFMTAFYALRQVGLTFFGEERWRTALAPASGHAASAPVAPVPAPIAPPPAAPAPAPAPDVTPGEKPRRPRPGQEPSAAAAPPPSAPADAPMEPPTAPPSPAPGEKPKRPRPGQTLGADEPKLPSASEPVPPKSDSETPSDETSATPAEKPRRPRPGQAAAPTPPATPVASAPPAAASTEPPATLADSGDKPRRPRPGQAAPSAPSSAPPAADAGDKPRRPRPGQEPVAPPPVAAPTPAPVAPAATPAPAPAVPVAAHAAHDDDDHHGHGFSGEPHESPMSMTVPLMILAVGAAIAGFINIPQVSPLLEHWLEPVFGLHETVESAIPLFALVGSSLAVAALGALLGMSMYRVPLFGLKLPQIADPVRMGQRFSGLYNLSFNMLYVDQAYDRAFVQPFNKAGAWLARVFDLGLIDGLINGIGHGFRRLAGGLQRLQTGYVRNYALSMVLGVVVLIIWFFFR